MTNNEQSVTGTYSPQQVAADLFRIGENPNLPAWQYPVLQRAIGLLVFPAEQSATAQVEEMIRFCPECGRLGDIPAGYEACCPDWSYARIVPKRFAELCAETFKLCVSQGKPYGWASPGEGNYFTRNETVAKRIGGLMPIYNAPARADAWDALTDETISTLADKWAARWRKMSAWNTRRCIDNALREARAILQGAKQ
ncbi:gp38 [Burkholderia aenigmatica]|uniref:hypothetical protein n=1 Tax=Burkholderia aenigmatica TaxID=2015348 RepID=UPI0014544DCE|nr:hypothetical protein [Burkholderia aenigmatica]VWD14385.1 gp38 [Burkholderia aenigmatica]